MSEAWRWISLHLHIGQCLEVHRVSVAADAPEEGAIDGPYYSHSTEALVVNVRQTRGIRYRAHQSRIDVNYIYENITLSDVISRSVLVKRVICPRHPNGYPCTCAMGNVFRFLEPIVLYMLREEGQAHGYQLANSLQQHALTDAEIEGAALYRTLRRLEEHDYVQSRWDVQSSGPARRVYSLTKDGEQHLDEWAQVLDNLSKSMAKFVKKTRKASSPMVGRAKHTRSSPAKSR